MKRINIFVLLCVFIFAACAGAWADLPENEESMDIEFYEGSTKVDILSFNKRNTVSFDATNFYTALVSVASIDISFDKNRQAGLSWDRSKTYTIKLKQNFDWATTTSNDHATSSKDLVMPLSLDLVIDGGGYKILGSAGHTLGFKKADNGKYTITLKDITLDWGYNSTSAKKDGQGGSGSRPFILESDFDGTAILQNVTIKGFERTAVTARDGNITLEECKIEGIYDSSKSDKNDLMQYGVYASNKANVTIRSTDISGVGSNYEADDSNAAGAVTLGYPSESSKKTGRSVVTIESGTFKGQYGVLVHNDGANQNNIGTVVIKGGEFKGEKEDFLIQSSDVRGVSVATLQITGGKYSRTYPDPYVMYGYETKSTTGDYAYEVVAEGSGSNNNGGNSGDGTDNNNNSGGGGTNTNQSTAERAADLVENMSSTVANSAAGQALANALQGSDEATQAAAVEVTEALTDTLTDEEIADLTAYEITVAITNQADETAAAAKEASDGAVEDPKTPAGTDLLADSDNAAIKAANESLSAKPKLVEPEKLSEADVTALAAYLGNVTEVEDENVELAIVQEAANDMKSDIAIDPGATSLEEQAKAIEAVYEQVAADLANVSNSQQGKKGVVIAAVLPKMTPSSTGFYPVKLNLRHLKPGRRLSWWASPGSLKNKADRAAVSVAETVGDKSFFLDKDGNPVSKVAGNASEMTLVAYLEQNNDYSQSFITADASDNDLNALETLAAATNNTDNQQGGGDQNPPQGGSATGGSGGGCEVGLGLWSLAALMAVMTISKKR